MYVWNLYVSKVVQWLLQLVEEYNLHSYFNFNFNFFLGFSAISLKKKTLKIGVNHKGSRWKNLLAPNNNVVFVCSPTSKWGMKTRVRRLLRLSQLLAPPSSATKWKQTSPLITQVLALPITASCNPINRYNGEMFRGKFPKNELTIARNTWWESIPQKCETKWTQCHSQVSFLEAPERN